MPIEINPLPPAQQALNRLHHNLHHEMQALQQQAEGYTRMAQDCLRKAEQKRREMEAVSQGRTALVNAAGAPNLQAVLDIIRLQPHSIRCAMVAWDDEDWEQRPLRWPGITEPTCTCWKSKAEEAAQA
jgi:hypothetical protein